ncbi:MULTISPECIES: hypothetical protein [Serratia]|uniref:hypothetical protein n=1 Tax=Serratia TaxID=613 RepID=UPI000A3EBF64|nr:MULTISPECIES: hypothetical protein [Serratia]MBE0152797.1 hypothetical protein [Serratia fonticola]
MTEKLSGQPSRSVGWGQVNSSHRHCSISCIKTQTKQGVGRKIQRYLSLIEISKEPLFNMVKLGIPARVWNGIEFSNHSKIAQEVSSNSCDTRRWVALYALFNIPEKTKISPHAYDFLRSSKDFKYCVVDFEIPKNLIEFNDGLDSDNTINLKCLTANTEEELDSIFKQEGINPALFVPPWRCNYPI